MADNRTENISQSEAYKNLAGQKPAVGGGPNAILPAPWDKFRNDNDPRATALNQSQFPLIKNRVPDVTNESARIGDYVIRYGVPEVVPNSRTGVNLQYFGIRGGTEHFNYNDSPIRDILSSAVGLGVGSALVGTPLALALGTPFNVYNSQKAAAMRSEALQNWRDQAVTLEKYATFNDDGTYSVDTSKMAGLDSRSGEGAIKMQEIETDVGLTDDGTLKVMVSPAFKATKTYQDLMKDVSIRYAGLTKDHAQYQEIIDSIKNAINAGKNQLDYEMREYGVYKNLFSNADDDILEKAYMTQLGGYLGEHQMDEYDVTVMREGEETIRTAKEVLDEFYNKNKDDKSNYVLSLQSKLDNPDISDDEKALVQGELSMLYAASSNENAKNEEGKTEKTKYFGMMSRGVIETFLTEFRPLFGVSVANVLNVMSFGNWWKSDLQGLSPDEAAKGFALLWGTALNVYTTNYFQNSLIENTVIRNLPAVKSFVSWSPNSPLASSVKQISTDFAINVVSDSIYDVAQTGVAVLGGREDKFWDTYLDNLQQDIIMDVVVTGMSSVQMKDSLSRRATGTDFVESNPSAVNDVLLKNGSMNGDEVRIRDNVYEPSGDGGGQKLVSTEDVGSKIAKKIANIEENAKVGKFRELFMDKNEAITAEAMKAYGASQDRNLYLRGIESSQDIRRLTGYEVDKINSDVYVKGTNAAWRNLATSVFEFSNKGKFKKAEVSYMVAAEELARYREAFRGDADNLRAIEEFYRPYIDAVPAAKRAQLDSINKNLKEWLIKVGDSYVESGVGNKEALADMRDGDVFEKIGWVPLWGKKNADKSLFKKLTLSDQIRKTSKNWVDIERLYSPEEFESPVTAGMKWASNIANNIAVNERNKDIIRLAEAAGDIRKTISAPSIAANEAVENLDAIKTEYANISEKTKENIRKKVPTQEEYRASHERAVKSTKFDKAVENLDKIIKQETLEPIDKKIAKGGMVEGVTRFGQQYKVDQRVKNHFLGGETIVRGKTPTTPELAEKAIYNAKLDFSTRSTGGNYIDFVNVEGVEHQVVYNRSKDDGRLTVIGAYPTNKYSNLDIMRANIVLNNKPNEINAIRRTSAKNLELNKIQVEAAEIIRKVVKNNAKFRNDEFVDAEKFITETLTPMLAKAVNSSDVVTAINKAIVDAMEMANPYISYEQVLASAVDDDAKTFRAWLEKNIKFKGKLSASEKDVIITDIMATLGKDTPDNYASGVTVKAIEDKNGGAVTYYDNNNRKQSFFIEGEIGRRLSKLANDPNTFVERGVLDQAMRRFANTKRLLTTGIDPTRALPNFARDLLRGTVTSGGDILIDPKTTLKDIMNAEGLSKAEIAKIEASLDLVVNRVRGETLNASLEVADKFKPKELSRAAVEMTEPKAVRYVWDVAYDKKALLKKPMDFFEGLTRGRLAKSAYTRSFYQTADSGMTLDQRIDVAMREARVAGTELTTNFSRKGRIIEDIAGYVPYFAQNFSNIESFKLAFVADPVGVGSRLSGFVMAYCYLLFDTLSNEASRKNYYNLTEYDRANNVVISVDGGSIITIPLDESLAGFVFMYRRLLETWNNVDPASFTEIAFGGLLEMLPLDLGGFSEGDSFNLQRGFERLGAQMLPTMITGIGQMMTGREWYYGSDIAVTDEELAQYGNYSPSAGDYTTQSKNSKTLAAIANATGIPQWQLQTLVGQFTGNVGQYVVNSLDKLSGATEDEQGGKEFIDAMFKSFTGMDSQNAQNQFYNGLNQLQKEKGKLKNELAFLNQQMSAATGQELVSLQNKYQEKKNQFATKVADFVNQYLNAYELTGGLSSKQASQIYYLFRLDDDRSIYEVGSPADYYNNQAIQQVSNEATREAAPILDRYYNQTRNLYQDAKGEWKVYSPYGERAYYNTVYGQGVKHEVALRNILDGKDKTLKDARTAMYAKRNAAAAAKDWETYERVALDYDKQVIDAISPYINRYGAENVLGESKVLDFLEEWIIVPNKWMVNKYGKNSVSLGNNASKQRAYVRPYIKYLFGLDTGYSNYNDLERANRSPLEY